MHKTIAFLTVLVGFLATFGLSLAHAHQTDSSTLMVHVKPEVQEVDLFISVSARDLAHDLGILTESEAPGLMKMLASQDKFVAELSADLTVRNNGSECKAIEEKLVMLENLVERVSFMKVVHCADELG